MIQGYELQRWDNSQAQVLDENGWELLLAPEDVREPGRIQSFTVISDGHKLKVELGPDETLSFIRRTRLLEEPGRPAQFVGQRYIVGKRMDLDKTEGEFFVVYQNGGVQTTRDSDLG